MTENSPKSRADENQRPIEKKRMGPAFWITLICFSSVWMFVFGVLVGRGTAPLQVDIQKLQKELIALKEAVLHKEKEQLETYSREINDKARLDFFVELKQSNPLGPPQAAPNGPPPVSLKNPDPKPQTTETPKPPAANPIETAPKPLPEAAKPDDKQPDEKKTAVEEKKSEGRWDVQVASMQDAAAADKMVEKLRQKGYSAYRFGANIPGKGVWYRIRVGPCKDRTDAQKKATLLKNDNFSTMLVAP